MKNRTLYLVSLLFVGIIVLGSCKKDDPESDNIWKGPKLTFTKANFADWTLAENQDRITTNVWLTRADAKGMINMAKEASYTDYFSPEDTEWAFGTTGSDVENLEYASWEVTHDSEPITNMLNKDMVLHLETDDIYIDIKFTAWTTGDGQGNTGGGGFTYIRSTKD